MLGERKRPMYTDFVLFCDIYSLYTVSYSIALLVTDLGTTAGGSQKLPDAFNAVGVWLHSVCNSMLGFSTDEDCQHCSILQAGQS